MDNSNFLGGGPGGVDDGSDVVGRPSGYVVVIVVVMVVVMVML